MYEGLLGQPVLVRSVSSGVHYGTLVDASDSVVRLHDTRRLWEWRTANNGISLTDIALAGIDPAGSRISPVLDVLVVHGVCEVMPAHGMARATIEGAEDAKAR